ncbi:hypothetical protein GJ744_007791 [Endocarpon pusillum]|uniref:Uncharacterized protein n=1 Tax=Endocarpon pusillum TaxID=364733 RepID=A0A8H7AZ05_9EURO|nr:hypothetical protein GJ744_007791 [Endocarpon pusillum]
MHRHRSRSTFATACEYNLRDYQLSEPTRDKTSQIDILRLLLRYVELEEESQVGTSFVSSLILQADHLPNSGYDEVLRWAMGECCSELNTENLAWMVVESYTKASWIYPNAFVIELMSTIMTTNVDVAVELKGFSSLHYALAVPFLEIDKLIRIVTSLVESGLNLYHVAYRFIPGGPQSPTTMAMRCSESFFCWRRVLVETGESLDSFVMKELQTSPLATQGWTKDTLLALFQYDFEPYPRSQLQKFIASRCRICAEEIYFIREIPWECKLEMIKEGRISELKRPHSTGPYGFASEVDQMHTYSVGPGDATTRPADARNGRVASPEQDDGPSGSDEDESTVSQTTSADPLCWPWQPLCDWCLEAGLTEEDSEEDEDGDDGDQGREAFNPKMPGSFDF